MSHILETAKIEHDPRTYTGQVQPAILDAVNMECEICHEKKSWVTKEDSELIKNNHIVFICLTCVSAYGVPDLLPVAVHELSNKDVSK
jgi:hypothetical protein